MCICLEFVIYLSKSLNMSEMNVPSAPLSKVFAPPCLSRVVNLCNLWFENFTRRPSTTTGSLKWLSKLQNQGLNQARAKKKDNIVIKRAKIHHNCKKQSESSGNMQQRHFEAVANDLSLCKPLASLHTQHHW